MDGCLTHEGLTVRIASMFDFGIDERWQKEPRQRWPHRRLLLGPKGHEYQPGPEWHVRMRDGSRVLVSTAGRAHRVG